MTGELEDRIAKFQRCIEARDGEAAKDVLHPRCVLVLVQPAKAMMPRDRWLEVLPDYAIYSNRVEERVVDLDGDVAAVLHRAEMAATVPGEDSSGLFAISVLWRRDEGRWQVWRSTPRRCALDACRAPGSAELSAGGHGASPRPGRPASLGTTRAEPPGAAGHGR